MNDLLQKVNSRYLLVNVVAHRARNIAEEADEIGEVLDKKPVSYAIDEIASGRLEVEILDDSPAADDSM